jgi:hypothetical protein
LKRHLATVKEISFAVIGGNVVVVFYIAVVIGKAPRNLIVETNDNAWCAGQGCSVSIDAGGRKLYLKPKGRKVEAEMRIVAENGCTGCGVPA